VDFKRLRSLYDELPFEKQKDFLQAFIEKIIIDPEWYEIHYTLPTGFEMDRYEHDPDGSDNGGPHGSGSDSENNGNSGQDGENSGNGCVPEGADKIRKSENGSLVSSPTKNSLSGINGDRTKERRLGTDRKNGKKHDTSRNGSNLEESKKPQGAKPISGVAKQQLPSHLSSYGKNGEGSPLWKIQKNVYRERWNPAWFWNGNIVPIE